MEIESQKFFYRCICTISNNHFCCAYSLIKTGFLCGSVKSAESLYLDEFIVFPLFPRSPCFLELSSISCLCCLSPITASQTMQPTSAASRQNFKISRLQHEKWRMRRNYSRRFHICKADEKEKGGGGRNRV